MDGWAVATWVEREWQREGRRKKVRRQLGDGIESFILEGKVSLRNPAVLKISPSLVLVISPPSCCLSSPAVACLHLVFVADIPAKIILVFWGICTSPNIQVFKPKDFSSMYINVSLCKPRPWEDRGAPGSVLVLSPKAVLWCRMGASPPGWVGGDHRGPPLQSLGGLISKGLSVLLEWKRNEQMADCRLPNYSCQCQLIHSFPPVPFHWGIWPWERD